MNADGRVLAITVGNRLRSDDGVAHRVGELIGGSVRVLAVQQLLPEIASEIEAAELVIFVDADVEASAPRLRKIEAAEAGVASLSHSISPEMVVALARELYEFRGEAWVCGVPACEFSAGEGLSAEAEAHALECSRLVAELIG